MNISLLELPGNSWLENIIKECYYIRIEDGRAQCDF